MRPLALALPLLAAVVSTAHAADCPDLTALQRAAGAVTWANFLQASAIALAVAGTLLFCSGLVRRFLQQVRLIEALLWGATVGLASGGVFLPPDWQSWTALSACLLLPGALALSVRLRQIPFSLSRGWQLLAVAWGAMAIAYQLDVLGFLAMVAFIAVLGLSIVVTPFCYAFGFASERAFLRASVGGALLALLFAGLSVIGLQLGPLEVFRPGALWMGGFAWFLGVLILSNKWFQRERYLRNQLVAVVSLVGSLGIGLVFGVRELVTLASAFLLFYVGAKVIEIPVNGRIALGLKLVATGGVISGAWYAVQKFLPLLV
jgi:hypothetical protein